MDKYIVNGIKFDTEEEANLAKKELNTISTIKNKYNIYSVEVAKKILEKSIDLFKTPVGYEFLEELKEIIENSTTQNKSVEKIIEQKNDKKIKEININVIFILFSLIFYIISIINFIVAFDKKNNYYNPEYSLDFVNAYVGGDAYNYIINASYFTGYLVLGGTFFICATLFLISGIFLKILRSPL